MPLLTHKSKQFLWVALKILIILGALIVLVSKFRYPNILRLSFIWDLLKKELFNGTLFILLGFTLLNWSCEFLKWQTLAFKVRRLRFRESATQSLAAHVSALITPAKIGEFGTKALYFGKPQRKKILFLSFLGNLYQMYATLLIGILGLGYLIFTQWTHFKIYYILGTIAIGICWYWAPKLLDNISWSYKGFSWQRIQEFTQTLDPSRIRKATFLAFVKYSVFSHQFFFLLIALGMDLPYLEGMALITAVYLVSSVLPVIQLFDVLVRGSVAVSLFGLLGYDTALVLTATTIMWFLNVGLPILPGMYWVARLQPRETPQPKEMTV